MDVGRIAESETRSQSRSWQNSWQSVEKNVQHDVTRFWTAVWIQMRIVSFWGWYAPNSSVPQPSSRTRRGEAPTPCVTSSLAARLDLVEQSRVRGGPPA